ncbi:MAG: SsrA-binding protein SmpB [Candidatus Omnitrophica bacterium]|nr:SsrA-binding protein SmpB [Candidatus Omnitrophota bacterium]
MKTLAFNRRAKHDYKISETFEAGLVLTGQEVKSAKQGNVSLKGSYVTIKNNEAWLLNAYITPYKMAGPLPGYDPTRSRKLLLKKSELKSLIGKKQEKGLTLVPLCIYNKKGLLKLEFGIGRGKKKYDKREDIKKKEARRKIERALRNKNL